MLLNSALSGTAGRPFSGTPQCLQRQISPLRSRSRCVLVLSGHACVVLCNVLGRRHAYGRAPYCRPLRGSVFRRSAFPRAISAPESPVKQAVDHAAKTVPVRVNPSQPSGQPASSVYSSPLVGKPLPLGASLDQSSVRSISTFAFRLLFI